MYGRPMANCPICGITVDLQKSSDEPMISPLKHSDKKRIWCADCQAASPVDYYDFNIRDTSIKFLINLAETREGRAQIETIGKIQDIISRHPDVDHAIFSIMRTCFVCGILFSQSIDTYKEWPRLCSSCTFYDKS